MIVRIHVATTHRDAEGLERRGGDAYLVDEAKARELAGLGVLEPRFEHALDDEATAVAALADELFLVVAEETPAPEA